MPANVEIKAIARNVNKLLELAQKLSDGPALTLDQQDTFFKVPNGRLKLRQIQGSHNQLIYYERSDTSGPKRSDYSLCPIEHADELKTTLGQALGVRGTVTKQRKLFLIGQTRVHIDAVEGLGDFIELEVVLKDDQTTAEGEAIAEDIMKKLELSKQDLISGAYFDLLSQK